MKIPDSYPLPEEINKFMKVNIEILKQDLTDHIDKEIKRFNDSIKIHNPNIDKE